MPILVPIALGTAALVFPPTRRRFLSVTKVVVHTGLGVAATVAQGTVDAARAVVQGTEQPRGGSAA